MTKSALIIIPDDDGKSRAEKLAAGKDTVAHVLVDREHCPTKHFNCISCEYTDRIGYCCYPVNIQEEIKAGLARPMPHDWNFPERDQDLQLRAEALAFRDVDRR